MRSVDELLDYVVMEIDNVPCDTVFLVKDLFKGYEWKQIALNDRLHLGLSFLSYVNNNPNRIVLLEKTASNQQEYRISS